ncbi:hypothetical protein [Mesorhizobium sp. WSM4935]|uniref:hypothetical protein n=1 Tax=Mesorhizobium sp. WSM4935 TaxID=3038547 RepID=UPI00301529D0
MLTTKDLNHVAKSFLMRHDLTARALLAAVFWPSLFFFWFLGPFVFLLLSTTSSEVCPRLETRAEFLAAANGTLPMLVVQTLIYAVPIVCLVLWNRLSPEPARAPLIATCIKLFAAAVGGRGGFGLWLVLDLRRLRSGLFLKRMADDELSSRRQPGDQHPSLRAGFQPRPRLFDAR